MRPGAPSAFYRTKCTECSAMDVNLTAFVHPTWDIRGLRVVTRKSYGHSAMDSCLVSRPMLKRPLSGGILENRCICATAGRPRNHL